MRSISRQVVSTVLVAQLILVTCIITLLLLHERSTRLRGLDARLQGRADSLAGAIQDSEDSDANVFVDPGEFQMTDGDQFAVYTEGGRLIAMSPGATPLLLRKGSSGFRDVSVTGVLYRVRQQAGLRIIDRAETQGVGLRRPISIVYATPETGVRREIAEATRFYVLAGLLTTTIVALLVTWSLRRSLQPISELADAAAAIQAPPDLRFSAPASVLQVKELAVLAGSLEAVVSRVQRAFEKEQQFVSDAAHELKTAVAVIHSSVQVLLVRPRSAEEYVAGLHRLHEDTARLEGIVVQMLQSADAAETLPGERHCDLYEIAEVACAHLRPMSEDRRIAMRVVGEAGAYVPVSAARATLLLENLVTNALQHSGEASEVLLTVQQTRGQVILTVCDQGAGIHPDATARVFERFYREDASRSRNTGGTGLGLAICKAIVETAGGHIALKSELGVGTTVKVAFTSP